MMRPEQEEFIGDGVFASFDGFMLTLRAPREHGDHYVVIEPFVLRNLLEFAAAVGMLEREEPEARDEA